MMDRPEVVGRLVFVSDEAITLGPAVEISPVSVVLYAGDAVDLDGFIDLNEPAAEG